MSFSIKNGFQKKNISKFAFMTTFFFKFGHISKRDNLHRNFHSEATRFLHPTWQNCPVVNGPLDKMIILVYYQYIRMKN